MTRKRLGLEFLLAVLAFPVASPQPSPSPKQAVLQRLDWELIDDIDGIKTYKKESAQEDTVAVMGNGVIEAPLIRVASVLLDLDRSKEWMDDLKESRAVKVLNENERYVYNHVGTPFVLKDRDFFLLANLQIDSSQNQLILKMHSVESPLAPQTEYVRAQMKMGEFLLKADNQKTVIQCSMDIDLGGNIPKWIVNSYQKQWARNTIQALRKQVTKPEVLAQSYQNPFLIKKLGERLPASHFSTPKQATDLFPP